MTTQEYLPSLKFEQQVYDDRNERILSTERMGAVCLTLADLCIRYAGVERVPRYHEQHRENDAEHSLMVAIVSVELANELRPDLDKGLLAQYANVHDFVEIAVGDTPTYSLTDQQLLDKHAREQAALVTLLSTLPPYTATLLETYERQESSEARFVRAVDKLTPLLVDILGPGKMVMCEDYGITDVTQLLQNKQRLDDSMRRRFGEDTPEIVDLYYHLGDIFTDSYKQG
jgi:5'-deoxynucleotidase YfbR-like HD superfamily hydrolase